LKKNPLCIYNPISLLAHLSRLVLDAAAAANLQKHLRSLLAERQTYPFRSIVQQQKQFHCFFCSQTKSSISAETLLLFLSELVLNAACPLHVTPCNRHAKYKELLTGIWSFLTHASLILLEGPQT